MMNFKVTIPLNRIEKQIFNDHDQQPIAQTPSDPELAEANKEMAEINRDIRDKEGRDVKTWRDML